jgi:hypothetical protein
VKERKVVIFPRGRAIDMVKLLSYVVLPNHRGRGVPENRHATASQVHRHRSPNEGKRCQTMSWNQLGLACIGRGSREKICPGRLQWQRVARHWLVSREGSGFHINDRSHCVIQVQGQNSNVAVDDCHFPGHLLRWWPNRVSQLLLSYTRCRWRWFLMEYSLSVRTAVLVQLTRLYSGRLR